MKQVQKGENARGAVELLTYIARLEAIASSLVSEIFRSLRASPPILVLLLRPLFPCRVSTPRFIEGSSRLKGGAKALDVWRLETKIEAPIFLRGGVGAIGRY